MILNTRWIGGRTTIGIVLIENEIGEQSARIATVQGFDESMDKQLCADWGAKLSCDEAKGFFPEIDVERYKKK